MLHGECELGLGIVHLRLQSNIRRWSRALAIPYAFDLARVFKDLRHSIQRFGREFHCAEHDPLQAAVSLSGERGKLGIHPGCRLIAVEEVRDGHSEKVGESFEMLDTWVLLFVFVLGVVRLLGYAALLVAYVLGPVLLPLGLVPEAAGYTALWAKHTAKLLVWPVLWAVEFRLFDALKEGLYLPDRVGHAALAPFAALGMLLVMWKTPLMLHSGSFEQGARSAVRVVRVAAGAAVTAFSGGAAAPIAGTGAAAGAGAISNVGAQGNAAAVTTRLPVITPLRCTCAPNPASDWARLWGATNAGRNTHEWRKVVRQAQAKHTSPHGGIAFVASRNSRLPPSRMSLLEVGARRQDKGHAVCLAFSPSRWARTPPPHPFTP